jgi:hypothetical protein
MSPVALGLDILLMLLLIAALGVGLRLNRRLTALREGHAAFAKGVAELNAAAARAEAGLTQLRAVADETHDALLTRIETARGLIGKLEAAASTAERAFDKIMTAPAPAPVRPPVSPRPLRFADTPVRASEPAGRGDPSPFDLPLDNPVDPPLATHEEQLTFPARRRIAADDDLFEEPPRRTGGR